MKPELPAMESRFGAGAAPQAPQAGQNSGAGMPPVLTGQHTPRFVELLTQLGISLAVTTYQAGKLVLLRAKDGVLNTHFREFSKPMGLAFGGDRLAIGTTREIWEFHNAPAVARRLEPANTHDACFLPRGSHTTGDIEIHEMLWAEGRGGPGGGSGTGERQLPSSGPQLVDPDLWFINTRFSCLCTRDVKYSFVPRWRPPFITAIAPEDRCHLNGVCLAPTPVGPTPAIPPFFVTALGETDTPGGWRDHKASGGILMETGANEILLRGLSMPHSPRVYAGQLWMLESGNGAIGRVDMQARRYETIASLPGFTRGIDFHGRYAFIGLSQVRESAVFSGIKIAERPLSERSCGVWVVDLVTGQTVAWLKFDDAVHEIFAVTVLPHARFPDLINYECELIDTSFIIPDSVIDLVPEEIRYKEARP